MPRARAGRRSRSSCADHVNELREVEPGLTGLASKPQVAIGQRALIIERPDGGVMWDCTPVITDAAVEAIKAKGGIKAIAISHPHFYSTMVDWSRALGGVPIHLHEDNRDYVMRPDPAIELLERRDARDRARHHADPHRRALHRLQCAALGRWRRGARRADDGRFDHGGARHALGELHVLLSQPHPGQRPRRSSASSRRCEPSPMTGSIRAGGTGCWTDDAKAAVLRSADRYIAAIK